MTGYSYREDYMLTHDIDWFFCHNGLAFHAASNGGIVPKEIFLEKIQKSRKRCMGYRRWKVKKLR